MTYHRSWASAGIWSIETVADIELRINTLAIWSSNIPNV
jgi:hypothetical protein